MGTVGSLCLVGFGVRRDRDNDRLFGVSPASRRHRPTYELLKSVRVGADLDLRTAIVAAEAAMEEARHEVPMAATAGLRGTLKRLIIH